MEVEFGGAFPVRFLKPKDVKMFDSDGKEMEIPKCEHCGAYKTEVIGLKYCTWICCNCVVPCEPKEP